MAVPETGRVFTAISEALLIADELDKLMVCRLAACSSKLSPAESAILNELVSDRSEVTAAIRYGIETIRMSNEGDQNGRP